MEERKEQVEASSAVQAGALNFERLRERQRMNVIAFKSGEKAKLCGWFRISPFGDEVSNEFFLAGLMVCRGKGRSVANLINLLFGNVALCVLIGFLCWFVYRLGKYVDSLPAGRSARAVRTLPQTQEQFNAKVEAQQAKPCPTCGTVMTGKDCSNCGYQVPTSLRTARTSWPSLKRDLESGAVQSTAAKFRAVK